MFIPNKIIFIFIKYLFEISILVFFVGGFFKIFRELPSNAFIKLLFSITYLWFTVGMNVNFILPLLKIIDNRIKRL